jgi:uncharacterized phiE125 gp8 family phage protein
MTGGGTGTPVVSSAYDLITLAELKLFPGFSQVASTEDAILEALITAISYDFEAFWGTYGIQRAVTERHTWNSIYKSSRDSSVIWLEKPPIASVTSITDPAGNTISSNDYWIDSDIGALRMSGGWQIPQDSKGNATYWTIVYTGGHVAAVGDVPPHIKTAAKLWAYSVYKRPDRDVLSKSVGDLSVGYRASEWGSTESIPSHIANRICEWKKADV